MATIQPTLLQRAQVNITSAYQTSIHKLKEAGDYLVNLAKRIIETVRNFFTNQYNALRTAFTKKPEAVALTPPPPIEPPAPPATPPAATVPVADPTPVAPPPPAAAPAAETTPAPAAAGSPPAGKSGLLNFLPNFFGSGK